MNISEVWTDEERKSAASLLALRLEEMLYDDVRPQLDLSEVFELARSIRHLLIENAETLNKYRSHYFRQISESATS